MKQVVKAFEEIFGRQTSIAEKEIAPYVNHLGARGLIEDMERAKCQGADPRSIHYFTRKRDGAPRWEMLCIIKQEQEWEQKKSEELACKVPETVDKLLAEVIG